MPKPRLPRLRSNFVLVDRSAEDVAAFQSNGALAFGRVATGRACVQIDSPVGASPDIVFDVNPNVIRQTLGRLLTTHLAAQ